MILITGGAGFIGSNLLASCQTLDIPVAVCDVLGTGDKWRNVAAHRFHHWVMPEEVLPWLEANRPDCIFHLGAISATTERDGDAILRNNFQLSRFLWDWCIKHNSRFIYASSAATYGDGRAGFHDGQDSAHLATLRPLNPYGWSKHVLDRFVADEIEHKRPAPPQWAGLKFFNVYGANEYHKGNQASVVAGQFASIKAGNPIRLFCSDNPQYADGGQLRDFIYVRDCVNVMQWLYHNPGVSGLFNVGTGKARSFADLATALFSAMGQTPNIEYVPMPDSLKGKYQYFTEASMEKLRAAGYTAPATSLEEGITDYVQRYLLAENPYA